MTGPIALATCAEMPVEADESPLVAAFERAGVEHRWAVWDDPAEDWSAYAGVLIRTVWDYTERIDAFRSWVRAADAATTLWNPAPVVLWNSHKRYLGELGERGVAVPPTTLVPAGSRMDPSLLPDPGSGGFVVKPAESVGAIGLSVWHDDDRGRRGAVAAVGELHRAGQDALVQPILPGIHDGGETSMIFIDGVLSHAVSKIPADGDIRSQPEWGADLCLVAASPAHEDLARGALAAALDRLGLHDPLLYARVVCVDHDGAPCLMELELIEPDLYLGFDAGAADRLVDALRRRLER